MGMYKNSNQSRNHLEEVHQDDKNLTKSDGNSVKRF
jgi:hypothetical protein